MSSAYLLDTNISSDFIRTTRLDDKLSSIPISQLSISSITEAEIRYGLVRKPAATQLHELARLFLQTVDIRDFDSAAVGSYARLRTSYEEAGMSVGNLDSLIAAHAHSLRLTLVTRNSALLRLRPWIQVEQW